MAKKKRRFLKFIIVLFLLVTIPIGTFFVCFYNADHVELHLEEEKPFTDIAKDIMIDAVDNTKESHSVDAEFGEDQINQIINTVFNKIPESVQEFVPQAYLSIDGEYYNFNVEAKVKFFKTKVTLRTKLSEVSDNIVFKIENVKIGRIKMSGDKLASSDKVGDLETKINEALANSGLQATADIKNKQITYNKFSLIEDAITMAKKAYGDDKTIFYEILSSMLLNDMQFGFSFADGVRAHISLENNTTNANFCTPEKNLNLNFDKSSNDLEELIESGYCDVDHIETVWDYLCYGYDFLESDEQTYMDGVLATSPLGYNKTYGGICDSPSPSITSMMVDEINHRTVSDISTGYLCLLNEDEINQFLKSTNIIGASFLLHRQVSDEDYKVNYITIDNFYCNLIDDCAIFVAGVSINGYETSLIFDTKLKTIDNKELAFEAKDCNVYFGNQSVTNQLIQYMFGIMYKELNSDTLKIDIDNLQIRFNFDEVINSIEIRPELKMIIDAKKDNLELTATSGTSENSINDNGYIQLVLG